MAPAVVTASGVLAIAAMLSGHTPWSLPGLVLFVSAAVVLRTLDTERRERVRRDAIARHRAHPRFRPVPKHRSDRVC